MFSKRNIFVGVISVVTIGVIVVLLVSRQHSVVPKIDDRPAVNTVSQNEQIKHPSLPENSPFRKITPQVLKMANSKFRETAQQGRLLTKVLIEYGLIDGPLPPDKTQTLPPLVTKDDWDDVSRYGGFDFIEGCYAIHKKGKDLTKLEHQFYVQIMTTIGKQSPLIYNRFLAAAYLADSAIPGSAIHSSYGDEPEKFPASYEDVHQCYDSAFTLLLDQAESMSDFKLKMNCFYLSFGGEIFYNFLLAEAYSSTETTAKGLLHVLNNRVDGIVNKIKLIASRTKSPERRKSLDGLIQFYKKYSSHSIKVAVIQVGVRKQVRPFVETLIAAVNNEDSAAVLKHYLNPKSEFIAELSNAKSLRDRISGKKNTTSLRFLEMRLLKISGANGRNKMSNKGEFPIPDKEVLSISLYLAATDSSGDSKNIKVKRDWVRRNGRWKIINQDK